MRRLLFDVVTVAGFAVTSRTNFGGGEPVLAQQLALYQARGLKARRSAPATRVVLVLLSRMLDGRALMTVVRQTRSSGGIVRASGSAY
jgi:hypothetical protein